MESSPQVPLCLEDIARDKSYGINSDGALVGSRGNSADSDSGRSDSSGKARNASSSWMRSSKASAWGAQVPQHQHNRWTAALTPLVHGASRTARVAAWGAAQVAGTAEHIAPTGMEHSASGVPEQESGWQALTPEGCFDTPANTP